MNTHIICNDRSEYSVKHTVTNNFQVESDTQNSRKFYGMPWILGNVKSHALKDSCRLNVCAPHPTIPVLKLSSPMWLEWTIISQEGIKVERGHIDGALIWWECP